jgi:penicillin-binding protein-related factor A (putative recombinase)
MREKDFQTRFNSWLTNRFVGSGAFELKLTHEKSLPFSAVQEHQIHALEMAKYKSLVYKISDSGIGTKPFDCFKLQGVPAFVVVMYYKRGQKDFYMIDIDAFMTEMHTSERKSLTPERAGKIGTKYILGE